MLLDENETTGNVVTETTPESAQGDRSTASEPGEGDQSPKKKRRKRSSKKLRTVSVDSGIIEEVHTCVTFMPASMAVLNETFDVHRALVALLLEHLTYSEKCLIMICVFSLSDIVYS